ncbi:hypothetical protein A4H97_26490 [Niastella yeongjuensis]|uniref:Uncharacterized protein n=1 Tax=Niastella yeongjuensis TaxID=354355 RepID=A0A1V9F0E4_9BACT|nr:hypothetical protein A4H97_26490 [Niastella yeongjuensis]
METCRVDNMYSDLECRPRLRLDLTGNRKTGHGKSPKSGNWSPETEEKAGFFYFFGLSGKNN